MPSFSVTSYVVAGWYPQKDCYFLKQEGWGGEERRKERLDLEEGRESLVVLFKKGWPVQTLLEAHNYK